MSEAWSIAGEYLEACSCNFLCPCITSNASAPATEGFCKFAMAYRVESGRFGATDLGGVSFALLAETPAVMAAGGWVMGVIVDDAASPEQTRAIETIASGRAGGPMAAFAPLVADFRGVERHPIRFATQDGRRAVTIAGRVELEIEGVPSLAAPGEYVAIDNVLHPAATRLSLARALRTLIDVLGIAWRDASGSRNAHFARFAWNGAG